MKTISLDDKYCATTGRVYLNGCQALVRLPLMQRQRDLSAGHNTAGFISGYRGSPLGVYDLALWQAERFLKQHHVHFSPGINEDMAATAVWGSQQLKEIGESAYDGVFAIWYGKGPGVDRSGDPLKHGNYGGSAQYGGVLVVCGDDHGARSSTTAHQSDHALVHFGMPILYPATIQEYLDLGLQGFALSRYAGCWVGFKCVTDIIEGSASVAVDADRVTLVEPTDYQRPAQGLSVRIGMAPQASEWLMLERLEAAKAFARANRLDRVIFSGARNRLGIVTAGKAWLDTMEALRQLGIDETRAAQLGIGVYKLAMVWPLEPQGIGAFAAHCDELLVIEEKRGLIEDQIAALLFNAPAEVRPRLLGKKDRDGKSLLPEGGELDPGMLARIIAAHLLRDGEDAGIRTALASLEGARNAAAPAAPGALMRMPSFCAGCPHNTSTRVPEGSIALGGIGCHAMAMWLPDRKTITIHHMGGEGAPWIGQAPFMQNCDHIFQNLGDGTYFHSGYMAIRASVAAGTNITYKILMNGAISMTGGQPIEGQSFDGAITAPHVAWQVHAEGVKRIALVTDDLARHADHRRFPSGTSFHQRDDLDAVQREIREHKGTSVLIYEQSCATERRRLRKRGKYAQSEKRLFINEEVCEGCGDCGEQSNCVALEPRETARGRKRRINQSVCNQDISCVKGMCPSFVSVYGARLRAAGGKDASAISAIESATLPPPARQSTSDDCNILVAGIGGSGIITLGALLGIAAHMEDKSVNVLDITGLAQRNGPVTSHIRICGATAGALSTRIPEGGADLVLAADIVVAAGKEVLSRMSSARTAVVYNSYVAPTNAFARNPDLDFSAGRMEATIRERARDGAVHGEPATALAMRVLGNAVGANLFLLGAAWQRGLIPLTCASLERAIELNGAAVEMNLSAFRLGRAAVALPETIETLLVQPLSLSGGAGQTLDGLIDERAQWLTQYQDAAYAARYRALVQKVADAERTRTGTVGELSEAVARNYAKVLAYKDEYEVGRLFSRPQFREQLAAQFDGDYRLEFNLAPPLLAKRDPVTGRYRKMSFGPWMMPAFGLLARLRRLRGTPLDVFGYSAHRRRERQFIRDYESWVTQLLATLSPGNHAVAVKLAQLPERVRGYDVVKEASLDEAYRTSAQLQAEFNATPVRSEAPALAEIVQGS